jgi:hypothetical protein
MPERLPDNTRYAIVMAFLKGEARDSISSRLNVSTGAVSNVVEEFTTTRVGQEIDALRRLAVRLRKLEITADKATEGANLLERLKGLGVDMGGIASFVSDLYNASKDRGYAIPALVDGSVRLLALEKKVGMGYEDLIKSFEERSSKRDDLREEIMRLRAEVKKADDEKNHAIEDADTTKEELDAYTKASDGLRKVGRDIDDFTALATTISNAEELNYDAVEMAKQIAIVGGLESRRSKLEKTITDLEAQKTTAEEELGQFEDQLEARGTLVEKVIQAEKCGLNTEGLKTIRETVVGIGAKRGLEATESLKMLLGDLRDQYDEALGFEHKLERLKSRIETSQLKAEREETRAKKLEEKYVIKKSIVDAMESLLGKGVDGQTIVSWNAFLGKLGTDIESFGEDLEGYAKVKEIIAAGEEEVRKLKDNSKGLRAEIRELEDQKSEVEKSIITLRLAAVGEVKRVSSATIENITALQSKAEVSIQNAMASGIKGIEGMRSDVLANVQQVGDRMKEATASRLKEAGEVTEQVRTSINNIAEAALETGKRLGELPILEPLYELLKSGEGEPVEVHDTMQFLLAAYRGWLVRNKGESLIPHVDNLSNFSKEAVEKLRGEKATA